MRVVEFLLAIIAILASSHGYLTIKRNLSKSEFSDGGGSFLAQILGTWGRRPQLIYGPLIRGMMLLQLCRWKFSHDETLQQTFFSTEVEIY